MARVAFRWVAFTILRFHPGEKQTWVMPAYPRVH